LILKAEMRKRIQQVKILLIDDSKTALAFLETALRSAGLQARKLEFIAELINVTKDFHPDLIFLDINMPGVNGEQAGAIIRRHFPNARIVINSGEKEVRRIEVAKKIKAVAITEKGTNANVLVQLVESAMLYQPEGDT